MCAQAKAAYIKYVKTRQKGKMIETKRCKYAKIASVRKGGYLHCAHVEHVTFLVQMKCPIIEFATREFSNIFCNKTKKKREGNVINIHRKSLLYVMNVVYLGAKIGYRRNHIMIWQGIYIMYNIYNVNIFIVYVCCCALSINVVCMKPFRICIV